MQQTKHFLKQLWRNNNCNKIDGRRIGKGKFGKLSKKLNHLYEQLIEEGITQKKANTKR